MSGISHLKGVRTRYRKTLLAAIQTGVTIMSTQVNPTEEQQYLSKALKCADKIKMYVEKLEFQSAKVTSAMEEQSEDIDDVIEEDCNLCSNAMDYYLDLNKFKERLVEFTKKEVGNVTESDIPSNIVDLQREMKDILKFQIEQKAKEGAIPSEIVDLQREMKDILRFQIEHKENEYAKKDEETTSVKLPKLDLISFSGDKAKWIEFWDSFESSIHKNKHLSNIEKFNYLKGKLQGQAKLAIAGLTLSNDNYDLAVGILRERFGNKQDVIDLHYNQMINLPSATHRTTSLRDFLDKVKIHLRSLEVLKQNVDEDVFISIVKSKLPEEAMLQLEIQKGSIEKWTISSLCDKLNDYVIAREKSGISDTQKDSRQQTKNVNKGDSNTWRNKPFKKNGNYSKPAPSSAEALVVTAKTNIGTTFFDKCRYCGENHWSDECLRYQSIDERKKKLKGSCFKCLREGHKSMDCKRSKLCIRCNEVNSHHRSLCPKKFNLKTSSVHFSEELIVNRSPDSEYFDGTTLQNGNTDEQENIFITSSEMVLMQTAKTDVRNVGSTFKQTTRVLFDSGSQRTYISQSLANKLKLKGEKEEEIKLVTFGSEKAKSVKTWSTKLEIRLKNGKYFSIVANIVPVISGNVQRRKLDDSTITPLKQFVSDFELADNIPLEIMKYGYTDWK